jgi:hypothetical protein
MKTMMIIWMMIFLLPAEADILSDIFNGKYEEPEAISYEPQETFEEEDHGLDNGEHYTWDDLYLCTYCYDTEVIIDPYGDMGLDESDY